MKKIIWNAARNLTKFINPYMLSGFGLMTIFYGLFLLVPKANAFTLSTYTLFTQYHFDYLFSITGVLIGLWLFLTPAFAQQISKMILPLYLMSIYWIGITAFIMYGDITSNTWIISIMLAVLCLIAAANYSVNRDSSMYENVFEK